MPFPPINAALLIIGHGSTVNPDSSTPTHRCADEIRQRNLFAEVVCAFWKEEPSMREVLYTIQSEIIFVVPNFISEGYFTREVLPRELRLDGPVTQRDGRTIFYCDPVGIHPTMTKLLLHRADEVAPGVPRNETSLVIVGHGTSLNEQSRKAIESQVALIREGGHGFAEVLDAYMEEAPLVNDWNKLTAVPNVVVVPFFIADGLHSYQDIPVLLGIESEPAVAASQSDVFRQNPHHLRDRNLYYSSAIGTDPLMVDVILDQVRDMAAKHPASIRELQTSNVIVKLPEQNFAIGQVRCERNPLHGWMLYHIADLASDPALKKYASTTDAREIALYDDAENFRPLKTAPTLKRGWILQLANDDEVRLALDFIYPGALGLLRHFQNGTLHPVHLRETLGRQTGMYRFANSISDDDAQRLVACECDAQTKCLRRITWHLDENQPLQLLKPEKLPPTTTNADDLPLICVEACTHIVSAAREKARANHTAKQQEKP
ncbi:MAG: hypothetical protein K8R87_13185 [Verrucomicrobia bacterium]|nr:hypothetical protein [Verrucomicrobiota bacterium]